MALKDDFLRLLRAARDKKLASLDGPIRDALIEAAAADEMTELRTARRALLDLPDKITDGTRAELVAQWPADFPPLPLWFRDPKAAAAADPPGEPIVVNCGG